MGVFALDEGFGGVGVEVALAVGVVVVHRAEDVGEVVAVRLFVLAGAGGVGLLDPLIGDLEVGAEPGFVAEAPEDD